MHAILLTLKYLWYALVLMSPHDEMKELRNHILSDRVAPTTAQVHTLVLVLMQHEYVEPAVAIFQRTFELDLAILERNIQTLVLHVADAVDGQLGLALDKQNRLHFDILYIRHLPEVIDIIVAVHEVYVRQVFEAARIVMITVNHKDGHLDAQILVHVVRILIQVRVELDVLIAEHSLIEHLLQLEECFA